MVMSDGSHQVSHIDTDNTYIEYQSWQYFHDREERKWHRRVLRKLQRLADWFDNTFGWFFCQRRFK